MAKQHESSKKAEKVSEAEVTEVISEEVVVKEEKKKLSKDEKKQLKREKKAQKAEKRGDGKTRNPFVRFGRYIKGAWFELRQVRWPDRKNTWAMTGALLIFTGFFVILILLLDAGFQFLFKEILG